MFAPTQILPQHLLTPTRTDTDLRRYARAEDVALGDLRPAAPARAPRSWRIRFGGSAAHRSAHAC